MNPRDTWAASELEEEFDLEMDELDSETDEFASEQFADFEDNTDFESELSIGESLAERLSGLAAREFESELELDEEINDAVAAAEERFIGRALGKAGKYLRKKAPALLRSTGLNIDALKKALPVDILRKSLVSAAKGLMAANPALAALAPALEPMLKSLGLPEGEFGEPDSEAWRSFEVMAEDAYEHLVGNLSDKAVQPLAAMQLAAQSLQHGAQKARAMATSKGSGHVDVSGGRKREIRIRGDRLRRGDRIVIRIV